MSNVLNLDYNNLLLRGSSLRNTEYIFGIVIYVGHNTKIMLNLKCFAFGSETMATLSCFENFAPECLANATKFGLNLW